MQELVELGFAVGQTLGAGKLALEQIFGRSILLWVHLQMLCICVEAFSPKHPRSRLMHSPGQK